MPCGTPFRPILAEGWEQTCAAPEGLISRMEAYPAFRAKRWRSMLGYHVVVPRSGTEAELVPASSAKSTFNTPRLASQRGTPTRGTRHRRSVMGRTGPCAVPGGLGFCARVPTAEAVGFLMLSRRAGRWKR